MYKSLNDKDWNKFLPLKIIFNGLKSIYLYNGEEFVINKKGGGLMVNFPLDLSQDSYIEEIIVTKKAFSLHWNIELCLKSENRPIFKEPIISLFSEYNKKNSQNLSFQEYELLKKINYYKTTRLYWGYYYDFIKRRIVVKTTVPILIINPSLEEEIFYERLVVRLIGEMRKDINGFLYN